MISMACNNTKSSYLDMDRLNLIDELITKDIKENKIPGAVVLVGNEKESVVFS